MFSVPSPSTTRGDVVLQPNYFTSSVYLQALRNDLSTLVLRYHDAYRKAESVSVTKPFALFKSVWSNMGWKWLHFKVFDPRSRNAFLDVTFRIFLERTVKTEAPFTRIVALFALYTFFYTQVRNASPPLFSASHIPIHYDHYLALNALPESLKSQQFLVFEPHVRYLLSRFRHDQVFLIVPDSSLGCLRPRTLPHETFAEEAAAFSDSTKKRKGRPSKREKNNRARLALDNLGSMLDTEKQHTSHFHTELDVYRQQKVALLAPESGISVDVVSQASAEVLDRLKYAQSLTTTTTTFLEESEGVRRVKQVMAEKGANLLGLT